MTIPAKVWYNPRLDPNTQYQISLTPQDGECWREHTVIASFKERDVRYVLCDQGLAVRLDSLDYSAHREISIEWDAGFTKHSIEPHWCALLGYQGRHHEFSLTELAEIPSLLKRFEITEFMVYEGAQQAIPISTQPGSEHS